MQYDWLIIDGYNLLYQEKALVEQLDCNLQGACHRLVRHVEATAHAMAEQTTIVFDGNSAERDLALSTKFLEVFFAPSHLSADSVIERLVCKSPDAVKILVVTSDYAEQNTVSSAGAHTMSSEEFIERCNQRKRVPFSHQASSRKEPKLGDIFPDN